MDFIILSITMTTPRTPTLESGDENIPFGNGKTEWELGNGTRRSSKPKRLGRSLDRVSQSIKCDAMRSSDAPLELLGVGGLLVTEGVAFEI